MHFDVVVLGGGVAGSAAALAAASSGARTCVVAGAPGASAMFSGAWRGSCPDALRRALAGIGYELAECTAPLPHPYGHLVACDAAPTSHAAARLTARTIVIGVAGLPSFDAAMLARQWSARAQTELHSETVIVAETPADGWSPTSIAARIESAPEILVEAARAALRKYAAQRAIVPPVLGVTHGDAVCSAVSRALDCEVSEALSAPPSLPGWRLHNALRALLARAGITLYESKGFARVKQKDRISEIELFSGDVVAGRSFVLATGKYATGGIEADVDFREPALGCPVWVEHLGEKFTAADSLILTEAARAEAQPLLYAGVHADADHRPVDDSDVVVYRNVFVAGSVRAGWSVGSHSIGAAATDGWAAGLQAVSA